MTTVWYFTLIQTTPFLRPVNSRGTITIFCWCLFLNHLLWCCLERFGTLFSHHFEILEVSEALDATTGKLSARSTSWEGSRSLWSSTNHEQIRNTYKKEACFFQKNKIINVKSLQNGSGVFEMRSYFVRMISWGPRRSWDRFWPKFHGNTQGRNKFYLNFPGYCTPDHVEGHAY